MGINLHLFAHRSYPYIDNLHIYVVKRWLRHTYPEHKMLYVNTKQTNSHMNIEHESTPRTHETEKNIRNACKWKSAMEKTQIYLLWLTITFTFAFQMSARAHWAYIFFNHTAELTNCDAMRVCALYTYICLSCSPSKWTHILRKHMMRIDFLLANIRVFWGAADWWCYCCCQKSCMSRAKQKVVSTITTKQMDCFTFFCALPFGSFSYLPG